MFHLHNNNLLNLTRYLPLEICRIIYLKWYYPSVMEELLQKVPENNIYTCIERTEHELTRSVTVMVFRLTSGSITRVTAEFSTMNRLHRKNTLETIVGRVRYYW